LRQKRKRPLRSSPPRRPAPPSGDSPDAGVVISTEALRVIMKAVVIIVGLGVTAWLAWLGADPAFLASVLKLKL